MAGWMAAALLAAEAAAAPLAPAGKWNVEYNQGNCTLVRRFGAGEDVRAFAVKRTLATTHGDLVLVSPAGGRNGVKRGDGEMVLSPSGTRIATKWVSGPLGGRPLRTTRLTADDAFWAALPTSEALTLKAGPDASATLALGRMAGPLKAMAACQDDLLTSLGVDRTTIISSTGVNPAEWFGPDDYPSAASMAGLQGRTVALLSVDRRGKVAACRTLESSGVPGLDEKACYLAKRNGRYPGIGADGPETRSTVVAVRWTLQD